MDREQFERYLKERYQKEIAWYDRKSKRNQRCFRGTKIYVVAVAVAAPLVLSANILPVWIVGLVFASIAVVETVSSLFKFHELWITYRTTCETLKKEDYFYRGNVGEYAETSDKEALFIQRVESLISRENTLWLVTSMEEQKKS